MMEVGDAPSAGTTESANIKLPNELHPQPGPAPPTTRQREAIESWNQGDVCVVAGPGSGKTRVLVERFRWLVQAKGVPVRRILAITFTEKAAANMRRRLVESFAPDSPERQAVERAYISTIHAFCARLIRENAVEAAVDPEFRVLDEFEADFELQRAIDQALEQEYIARPERVREFLGAFGAKEVPEALYSLYQALRAAGVTVEEARRGGSGPDAAVLWQRVQETLREVGSLPTTGWKMDHQQTLLEVLRQDPARLHVNLNQIKRGSRQSELLKSVRDELLPAWRAAVLLERHGRNRDWFLDALALADRLYREAKRAGGALDYSDLEEGAIRLLESAGGRLRAAFSYLLMDEFQDTNPLQARLAGLLRGRGNFFAVGDINQSIYGFRHADPTVFRDYRDQTRQAGGHVVELLENFRSRPEILRAVRRLINGAEGIEAQELVAGRSFDTAGGACLEVLTVQAGDGEEAGPLEARHVAARIRVLVAEGAFAYGDMAVLLRTSALVRLYEKTLREQAVPCEVTEGRGFYDAREVNDLLAFLRVLLNPQDEISLAAVLRSPLAGVDDDTLLRLKVTHGSLIEGVERELGTLYERLLRFRTRRDYTTLDRLLGRLLAETGYEAWLLEQPSGAHAVANVRKLLALARRFQAGGLVGLGEFLERVDDLRREDARESDARPPEQSADAVQVMTIHAAKGLEFPVVFVSALGRGPKGDHDPVVFLPGSGVGMHWRDPDLGDDQPDAIALAIAGEQHRRQKEEEQRLFYVAITRAEQRLVLSASFGPKVEAKHWIARLKNLSVDLKTFDNSPREVELGDLRFRLLQTSEEPALADAPPPTPTTSLAPAVVERPDVEDQSDTSVAATSVAVFSQCPRKYYLERYLGFTVAIRDPEGEVGRPPGAAAGPPAVLEKLPESGRPGQGARRGPGGPPHIYSHNGAFSAQFGSQVHALLAGTLPPDQSPPEALELANNFHRSPLGQRLATATSIHREQSFLISLGGRLVSGQIDLWFTASDGETILVDFKTGETSEYYTLQLNLYTLAIPAPVHHAYLYFLRPNLAVEVPLDPAAARAKVEELYQAQSRLDFPLHEGPHCHHCPYFRGLCPAR